MVPQCTIMEVACVLACETLDDAESTHFLLLSTIFNANAVDTPPCSLLCTLDIQRSVIQLSISPLQAVRQEPIALIMSAHTSGSRPPHLLWYPLTSMNRGASIRGFRSWNMALSSQQPPSLQIPVTCSLALANPEDEVNGVWLQPGAAEASLQLPNLFLKEVEDEMHNPCAWRAASCFAFVVRHATLFMLP